MKYVLLLYENEAAWNQQPEAENEAELREYLALDEALNREGVQRGGEALLQSESATCVRVRDEGLLVTDGPFAETREQLGGYYEIEADDLDAAIGVARRIPAARKGTVEIRPVMTFE